ncbi:retron St85 family RNA-directed DNA polymerase [Paenisporosarcina cavernae]|uniref:RNA-directed DNA polymerase n=1 Tax=Paenisporosarcina cavernae TaxID=2320858 RepID=A0A385YTX9_9BACL|nr:retron St85 family RNA-directed DNA polymerase [Paenisporosarcina cavernae]AYC30335.1 RNA-directed DNA polymerase [Paenisporosarcina cavernae]
MDWEYYKKKYCLVAFENNISSHEIENNLFYAKKLYDRGLPIIYDEIHLGQLIGISHEYMFKVANDASYFYKSFRIKKLNGGSRKISEPLPNLKIIQKWILEEILYKLNIHPSAKAYVKGLSIKDNVKFHRNQKTVLKLDIIRFFNNVKEDLIYRIFKEIGYSKEISWLLTRLCILNGALPQGAVTSPYLSNLVMLNFDRKIYSYCKKKRIRYTRYADDLTFSGEINKHHVISRVKNELLKIHLQLNESKIRVLKNHQRQIITGIVVNKKIQTSIIYRKKIRQEVYYIKKFGIYNHISKTLGITDINTELELKYLKSLIGRIHFVIFVNKFDKEMSTYLHDLKMVYDELSNTHE